MRLRAAGDGKFKTALPGMAEVFEPLFKWPVFLWKISLGLFTW